jgi:hypothetical protein
VAISTTPKITNVNENASSRAAPRAMKTARRISARVIPIVSARDWCSTGTANAAIIITNTNRLSIERLFSTT